MPPAEPDHACSGSNSPMRTANHSLAKAKPAELMFASQCVINFFIHSGTAQAALTIPIMAPPQSSREPPAFRRPWLAAAALVVAGLLTVWPLLRRTD